MVDNAHANKASSQGGREGAPPAQGKHPDALPRGARNSSGANSAPAQLLQLQLKCKVLAQVAYRLAIHLGDEASAQALREGWAPHTLQQARDWDGP